MKIYSVSYSTLPSQCRTRSSSLVFTARLLSYTSHFPTGLYISEATVKNPENRNTLNRSITTWVPLTFNELAKKKRRREKRNEDSQLVRRWNIASLLYIYSNNLCPFIRALFAAAAFFFPSTLSRDTMPHVRRGDGKKIVCAHRRGTTTAAGADHGKFYV